LKALFPGKIAHQRRIAERVFMAKRWLSVNAIVGNLEVNPDTIYKWITRKSMPAHKLGRL